MVSRTRNPDVLPGIRVWGWNFWGDWLGGLEDLSSLLSFLQDIRIPSFPPPASPDSGLPDDLYQRMVSVARYRSTLKLVLKILFEPFSRFRLTREFRPREHTKLTLPMIQSRVEHCNLLGLTTLHDQIHQGEWRTVR
jgi:hypothetical protein